MNLAFLRKKELIWFVVLIVIFFALRLPNLHYPYHQDEYKWPQYANPEISEPGTVVHPPLAELVYRKIGPVVGYDNFRTIPLVFSAINLFLIFCLANIIFNKNGWFKKIKEKIGVEKLNTTSFWITGLFVISFFSVLASLMVDVDGAVMPMFFLIMAIGYFQLRKTNFQFSIHDFKSWIWLTMIVVGAVGGFMVKVSGILPIIALFLDFLIEKSVFSDKKKILKYAGFGILGIVGLVILLLLAKLVFPFFPLEKSITYWKHFANSSSFLDRGWLQTFIQFAKSLLYASPLLILPLFFIDRDIWYKTRPFFFFIFSGFLFYLLAFDFSLGALDRYMQFLIIPLCVIVGAIFSKVFNDKESQLERKDFFFVSIIAVAIFAMQFVGYYVPPLYPKTEWISRMVSLDWTFLYPFSGGSGPLGFYVSFIFIALIWVCATVFVLSALKIKNVKKKAIFCVLILGILYNGIFIEEYLFGKINGSSQRLVKDSVEFIKNDKSIKKVIVYNDNGGWNVRNTGKYERRMYATPQFETDYAKVLSSFSGHILFVDIPTISEKSFYAFYINFSCKEIYKKDDKYITAQVFDCQK